MRRLIELLSLLMLVLGIVACGDDSDNTIYAKEGNMEEALFMAYAGATAGQELNSVLIADFTAVANEIKSLMSTYYKNNKATAAFPVTQFNLATQSVAGLSGILLTENWTSSGTANINISESLVTLSGYQNNSQSYNGILKIDGELSVTYAADPDTAPTYKYERLNISTVTLEEDVYFTITASGRSYSTAQYLWQMIMEGGSVSPDYTLIGIFDLDDIRYTIQTLSIEDNTSTLSINGAFIIEEDNTQARNTVDGQNISSSWTSGTLAINSRDMIGSVTLIGSDAHFVESGSHQWEKENWRDDKLLPRPGATEDDTEE